MKAAEGTGPTIMSLGADSVDRNSLLYEGDCREGDVELYSRMLEIVFVEI
jgi:hypothetical protein